MTGPSVPHRAVFLASAEAVAAVVDRLPREMYGKPALGDWDVRALVGHTARALSTVSTYLAAPAPDHPTLDGAGAYFALASRDAAADPGLSTSIRDRGVEAGEALGTDPAAAFRAAVDTAVLALAAADDDRLVAVRGGSMRLATYLTTRTFELTVHGLDLAAATGEQIDLPFEAIQTTLAILADTAAMVGTGPEVIVSLTGRAPLNPGFTLVP